MLPQCDLPSRTTMSMNVISSRLHNDYNIVSKQAHDSRVVSPGLNDRHPSPRDDSVYYLCMDSHCCVTQSLSPEARSPTLHFVIGSYIKLVETAFIYAVWRARQSFQATYLAPDVRDDDCGRRPSHIELDTMLV
jgi:hypothetical protein